MWGVYGILNLGNIMVFFGAYQFVSNRGINFCELFVPPAPYKNLPKCLWTRHTAKNIQNTWLTSSTKDSLFDRSGTSSFQSWSKLSWGLKTLVLVIADHFWTDEFRLRGGRLKGVLFEPSVLSTSELLADPLFLASLSPHCFTFDLFEFFLCTLIFDAVESLSDIRNGLFFFLLGLIGYILNPGASFRLLNFMPSSTGLF